jgi:hypothetical protein
MFYLAAYSAMSGSFEGKTPARDSGSQAALAMIYIYIILYAHSWNVIPWIFVSEVLPKRVRTLEIVTLIPSTAARLSADNDLDVRCMHAVARAVHRFVLQP